MPPFGRLARAIPRLLRRRTPQPGAGSGLAEREEHYRLLAENARDIIWRLEVPDRLTYVSRAVEDILGWTPEEQLARPGGISMLTPESAAHVGRLMRRALADGLPEISYDAEHVTRDGRTVWCEVRVAILRDAGGDGRARAG